MSSVLLLSASTALAQAPAGPEFRVDANTLEQPYYATVASHPDGGFVVVWSASYGIDSLRGQRFDAQGQRVGSELVIATSTSGLRLPRVAADASGGFIVVWGDGSGSQRVYGRRFGAGGPVGPVLPLSASTTDLQYLPHVASDGSGNFVVVWNSRDRDGQFGGIFGQRFSAAGARLGAEFAVNTYTTGNQYWPNVALQPNGEFLAVWTSPTQGSQSVVKAQRFSAAAQPLGAELQLTPDGDLLRQFPTLWTDPLGGYQISWLEGVGGLQYGAERTMPLGVSGAPVAPSTVFHWWDSSRANPGIPAVVPLPDGDRAAAWVYLKNDSTLGLRARRFDASGGPRSGPFDFADPTLQYHSFPELAGDATGNTVAVWLAQPQSGQRLEVHAQRFGTLGTAALQVDTAAGAGEDGNGVLEPGESVDVRPSWRNNGALALNLDASIASLTGPAGPAYTILDGGGSYGTVPPATTRACTDCYRVSVTASTRPSLHWDAVATENIGAGQDGHAQWPLHVGESFGDVPRSHPFYAFIETLLHRGVTSGCSTGTYCPALAVTREQMAVFVLTSKEEPGYAPFQCLTPRFADVPNNSPFCRWIEELARRGVATGCGGGNYCPNDPVTRDQMAVFLLRTLDPALSPPACTTPMFGDVPASSGFCRWVEELARRGITAGCGGGNYCPGQPVTREQMAVFLTATFTLTLYGP